MINPNKRFSPLSLVNMLFMFYPDCVYEFPTQVAAIVKRSYNEKLPVWIGPEKHFKTKKSFDKRTTQLLAKLSPATKTSRTREELLTLLFASEFTSVTYSYLFYVAISRELLYRTDAPAWWTWQFNRYIAATFNPCTL